MTAVPSHAFDAIAFQLAAALEQYDAHATAMIEAWPDLERYREVSELIEKIRMYSSALPELRVQWVELLIAHAELVHVLWRTQYASGAEGPLPRERTAAAQLATVRERHADAVAALRNRCMRVMARPERPA